MKTAFESLRRPIFAGLLALTAVTGGAAYASDITMFRSPTCACCLKWIEHIRAQWAATGQKGEVKIVNNPQMQVMKHQSGVPTDLQSCHTSLVEGYVIEGHVPAKDIIRLLKEKPEGVRGLAVAGMPMGSPGMEHGDHRQAYKVIAFGPKGRSTWASYPASGG